MGVTHTFVSTAPPVADPTKVGSTEWNDAHVVSISNADVAVGAAIAQSKLNISNAATGVTGLLTGADWDTFSAKQAALTFPIAASLGGTGVNNGSFNLTVPATGTAALLGTANVFTAGQTVNAKLTVSHATAAQDALAITHTNANAYGVYLSLPNQAPNATNYLFRGDTGGVPKFTAYSDGSGFFTGLLTARLLMPAGGTAATTAPLKFTTQAAGLTTVEQGAMELVGNSLQFTQLAKRRGVAMTQATRTSSTTITAAAESAALVTAEHGANYLEVGKMEEIQLNGTFEQRANPATVLTFNIKYAGTTIHTIATTANNLIAAGSPFILRVFITYRTVGATGTAQINSWLEVPGETTKGGSTLVSPINTTAAENTTVTATWGEANAANILIVQQARVLCIETNK